MVVLIGLGLGEKEKQVGHWPWADARSCFEYCDRHNMDDLEDRSYVPIPQEGGCRHHLQCYAVQLWQQSEKRVVGLHLVGRIEERQSEQQDSWMTEETAAKWREAAPADEPVAAEAVVAVAMSMASSDPHRRHARQAVALGWKQWRTTVLLPMQTW